MKNLLILLLGPGLIMACSNEKEEAASGLDKCDCITLSMEMAFKKEGSIDPEELENSKDLKACEKIFEKEISSSNKEENMMKIMMECPDAVKNLQNMMKDADMSKMRKNMQESTEKIKESQNNEVIDSSHTQKEN